MYKSEQPGNSLWATYNKVLRNMLTLNAMSECNLFHKTKTIIMKKIEMLQELPKCYTQTQSEPMLMGKMVPTDWLNAALPQTFNL